MRPEELEIMAPAGSFESLTAAVQGGADSVYFGIGHLNMRSHSANNFAAEDLPEVMRICRAYGLKAYLTLNITLYGEELDEARRVLDLAKETGVNAVIASDMACILYARQIGLEVHISTQLSISNVEALRFYAQFADVVVLARDNVEALRFYAQFADVVVLARELRLEQVKEIYETIVREQITGPSGNLVRIEMFAHGAFCMAVSGKCYLSLAAYGESANRGACMQVCRRGYHVTDEETGFDLVVDNNAGVKVFKIEGRARAADYVKRVSSCYRRAADAVCDGTYTPELAQSLKAELAGVFNRGFWDGYYQGARLGEWSAVYGSQATRHREYIGKVTNWFNRINVAEIRVETGGIRTGDEIAFIGKTTGCVEMTVDDIRVDLQPVSEAPKGVFCNVSVPVEQQPVDHVNDNPAKEADERIHPRRGDKVFKWVED